MRLGLTPPRRSSASDLIGVIGDLVGAVRAGRKAHEVAAFQEPLAARVAQRQVSVEHQEPPLLVLVVGTGRQNKQSAAAISPRQRFRPVRTLLVLDPRDASSLRSDGWHWGDFRLA
jgi:hypothetical protein